MAGINWDKGLTLDQRRSLVTVALSAMSFVLGIACILLYTGGTVSENSLWLIPLGFFLFVATIFLALSGARGLLMVDKPSKHNRNGDMA
ncbi:hypothetical protein PbB2_02123 [Candidatus Phycosocius bacilliformis]|uniref:Uncharacterized protein n=1 Tax=Candidatus Phycosocius bacilliformis TaxID=1445552 RepID=A0A2P2EBL8_9PROT|nr:hypothetical protein [Candidatus Phycosocius bacilliformis]GBF58439.1 hypothetical protein PbB2_02123 [Candidatus Phycosocius bacilliformis]